MQREAEDEQNDRDRADGVGQCAFLDRAEFFVGDRHGSGQSHPCTKIAGQMQVAGRFADRLGCRLPGLKRVEIKNRRDEQECSAIGCGQRAAIDQLAPGKVTLARLGDMLERL